MGRLWRQHKATCPSAPSSSTSSNSVSSLVLKAAASGWSAHVEVAVGLRLLVRVCGRTVVRAVPGQCLCGGAGLWQGCDQDSCEFNSQSVCGGAGLFAVWLC
jgi:hypothetical protein